MDPLTPLPDCTDEVPCVPLELTLTGNEVAVADQLTQCIKRLQNRENAVLWTDGERVTWVTGEGDASLRLILDKLKELGTGAPVIVVQNGAGVVGKWTAPSGTAPHIIIGKNGAWNLEKFRNLPCFTDICECEPDWLAGFQRSVEEDGEERWCLVRMTPEQLGIEIPVIYFASTQTVQHTGTGTAGDPHKFHVKVSADDGNIVEARADGIYVACCLTYEDVLDIL